MFEIEDVGRPVAKIRVIGVGGGGGNAVNSMVAANLFGVEFIAVNTDIQHLEASLAPTRIQIGEDLTRGLGAGSNPATGRDAALESRDVLTGFIEGADMIFITAGMGGGTGTGAAPVIAKIAKDLGILTVAIVTKPFFFEGKKRAMNAEEGLHELRQHVNTLIVIPNDRISLVVNRGTSLLQSFGTVNDVLRQAVQGISDLVLVPGLINLDFADIRSIMQKAGRAVIGMGTGSGEGAAFEAARRAILNPLLEKSSIEGAKGILINITGGVNVSLDEIQEAASLIHDNSHEDANIILGAVIDAAMKDEIRVTVIATGLDEKGDILDVPETTVWKPKSEPVIQKSAPVMFSKNVEALSELNARPLEKMAELRTEQRAAETVRPAEPVVIPVYAEKPYTEKIEPAEAVPPAEQVQVAEVQLTEQEFDRRVVRPDDLAEERPVPMATFEPVALPAADRTAAEPDPAALQPQLAADLSLSTIPAEDEYDTPTFLRKKSFRI